MLIFQIHATLKPESVEPFKTASITLAEQTIRETGNTRFEILQNVEDPTRLVMFEAYKNKSAMGAHMQSIPFMLWKSSVEAMYAKKSLGLRYFPILDRKPPTSDLAEVELSSDPLIFQTTVNINPDDVQAFANATITLQRTTRATSGNIRFELLQEVKNPNRMMLFEAYRSELDVSDQVHSEHYQSWRDTTIPYVTDLVLTSTRYQTIFPKGKSW